MNNKNGNSFSQILTTEGIGGNTERWLGLIESVSTDDIEKAITAPTGKFSIGSLAAMLSPKAKCHLEQMAQKAQQITRQKFGNVVQMYAPLYISNYCLNDCQYCAFNKKGSPNRVRLSIDQACAEAEVIAAEGFRHILLVSGEDPKFVTTDYLTELTKRLREKFSSISIEIQPMKQADYEKLFSVGIDGIAAYQETYDKTDYAKFHKTGPKADYDWRLDTLGRAGAAGFRSLGLGYLIGLSDWRIQALTMALHANYLMKKYWQAKVSFSFPRMRPAADVDEKLFQHMISDSDLAQMMIALRLCFPDAEIVLSTRENQKFRDNITPICVTRVSAGSRTNPGGYANKDDALKQFEIADNRDAAEIVRMLKTKGLEAVWKDFDTAFTKEN